MVSFEALLSSHLPTISVTIESTAFMALMSKYSFIVFPFIILLLFYYSCPSFSPFALLHPAYSLILQSIPTPLSRSMVHSYMFFDFFLLFFPPLSKYTFNPITPHLHHRYLWSNHDCQGPNWSFFNFHPPCPTIYCTVSRYKPSSITQILPMV